MALDLVVFDNLGGFRLGDFRVEKNFTNLEEFTAFLTKRHHKEETYGLLSQNLTMCRFFETKDNENILADIEQTNREQNMGNYQIPNTNIKLINFSICPKCGHIFSFKELMDYYRNSTPDSTFKSRKKQYREDTRAFCHECKTYFLPALVIVDGTPKNEVQFLCRTQTNNSIEVFYRKSGKDVLAAKSENILRKEAGVRTLRAIRNDVMLAEMSAKPTLISNLLQYTPANLVLNLIDGSNLQKGDVLFGAWQ
jgi:hypothetical protein